MTKESKENLYLFLKNLPIYEEIRTKYGETVVTHSGLSANCIIFNKGKTINVVKSIEAAAERFYLELSEDNRRLLVERAVSIYDGRGLRNRNRNIKNQTACRETLSV